MTWRTASPRHLPALLLVLAVVLGACVGLGSDRGSEQTGDGVRGGAGREAEEPEADEGRGVPDASLDAAPDAPPAEVCGNDEILGGGPARRPRGSVEVPAGDNSEFDFEREGTTFWFAPGTHTLGTDEFAQIEPGDNSRFVGAPGAVLDGQKLNKYAFTQQAQGVTIEYLTIRNFGPVGDNNNEGVVNHDGGEGWTIRYNTIRGNAGAGMMIGSRNIVEYNCVTHNEQYGFNSGSAVGIVMDHNEISYNNTYDWEAEREGCGCTGGGKFWSVTNATITNNYVHHNKGAGLWADNNNSGFLFENNYVTENDGEGILYETSYNAVIRNNAIVRNALVAGPKNPSFPTGGIYVSESGADRRVDTRFKHALEITGNLLEDNWSGVVLWENADRYCGSPANTSTGECTLINPGVITARSCNAANVAKKPYFHDCRWRTQNVEVHHNRFTYDPAEIGPKCTFDRSCGLNAIISNYGTYPDWSPYKGEIVQKAITFHQGNHFFDNTYEGPWRFLVPEQGNLQTSGQWQSSYRQDVDSRFDPSA